MLITIFITYIKKKRDSSLVYAGRTHGEVSSLSPDELAKILRKRDSSHQKNNEDYGRAELENFSENEAAIRGHEQQLIDFFRKNNQSGNIRNGISKRNKNRKTYFVADTSCQVGFYIFNTS